MDRYITQASENAPAGPAMSEASFDGRRGAHRHAPAPPSVSLTRIGTGGLIRIDRMPAARPTALPRTAPCADPAALLGATSLGFGKPAASARHPRHGSANDRATA
jgi:hypothetical protein